MISINKSKSLIYIYDDLLNLLVKFSYLTQFKNMIKGNMIILRKQIELNKLFKGNWYIRNSLLKKHYKSIISAKTS